MTFMHRVAKVQASDIKMKTASDAPPLVYLAGMLATC